ncbi:MAG TPA: cytochrome o ubiquinol oxidase subunit IV [Caulobacteraceae bacterium]|jgi:cytochrome o ubiquinol oxidase operon protein cyoD
MTDHSEDATHRLEGGDVAPGDVMHGEFTAGWRSYVLGLIIAVGLTVASFLVARTHLIYGPSIDMALATLAVAQMGIHLIFFLHITTGPDNTNNVLALAFGILIVGLVVFGSVWIMYHLNQNMMPMPLTTSPQSGGM